MSYDRQLDDAFRHLVYHLKEIFGAEGGEWVDSRGEVLLPTAMTAERTVESMLYAQYRRGDFSLEVRPIGVPIGNVLNVRVRRFLKGQPWGGDATFNWKLPSSGTVGIWTRGSVPVTDEELKGLLDPKAPKPIEY
jgi:hypothetical protein